MATMMPPAFSWESQAAQYPFRDEPGVHWEMHYLGTWPDWTQIDCLLARDDKGFLVGILNRYMDDNNDWEKEGNVNLWVRPDMQRKRIGSLLIFTCLEKYTIDWEQQRYTDDGLAFIRRLMEEGMIH